MSTNTILTIGSMAVIGFLVIIIYVKAKHGAVKVLGEELDTFPRILEHIKLAMVAIDKEEYALNLTDAEFDRAYRRKARVREALNNCVHGIESAKTIVVDLIRNVIAADVKPEAVTNLLGLNDDIPPPSNIQFEIILYRYKKKHGKSALTEMIERYQLAEKRALNDFIDYGSEGDGSYYITSDDLVIE